MTALNKQALRERYSKKPAPKCQICGAVMTIQRAGAGKVVYGCTGRIDKDDEDYKFADGRGFADDHYARSRVTDYGPGGDPDVLALLDELEAAENNLIDSECHVAELEEALRDKQALLEALDNSLCELLPGTQYMDQPDGGSVTPLEQVRRMVAEYRERIEELESRTVTVKLPADYRNDDGSINDDMFNTCEVVGAFREALAAAGIGVKGE